ncbi:MAG: hypothetical protein ACKESB_01515 [Candidatus Hodgkinia cicadicola]
MLRLNTERLKLMLAATTASPAWLYGISADTEGGSCVVSDWGWRDVRYSERTIAARTAEIRDDIIELIAGGEGLAEWWF